MSLSELEKLKAGLAYNFADPEINARKLEAVTSCQKLNQISILEREKRLQIIHELFGSVGKSPSILPTFQCDYGKNIHIGDHFLMNYNGIILDIAPVIIGNHVMIGPNVLITTVGHPLNALERRKNLAIAQPVKIGNDVWIGGNVTILSGITIGNNAVIAAGAVVTKNIPDNCLVAGVPAKIIRQL